MVLLFRNISPSIDENLNLETIQEKYLLRPSDYVECSVEDSISKWIGRKTLSENYFMGAFESERGIHHQKKIRATLENAIFMMSIWNFGRLILALLWWNELKLNNLPFHFHKIPYAKKG